MPESDARDARKRYSNRFDAGNKVFTFLGAAGISTSPGPRVCFRARIGAGANHATLQVNHKRRE